MPAYNSISKLGIISANVNGFGQKQKRFNFFHHIKSANPDFILLSDTRLDTLSENELRNEIDYHCVFNSFSSDRRGVAILFKKTLPIKHSIINSDNNGNLLSLEIEYDHKKFLLTAIYGPNTDRPDFFENLFELNNQVNCPMQIIGGDFNVTLNHEIDNFDYIAPRNVNSRRILNNLLSNFSFFDVFRNFFPDKKHFTWKKPGSSKRARLDMFIASNSMRPYITKYKKLLSWKCDHDPISIDIDFASFKAGKAYWRHNNALLKDDQYVFRIKNYIRLTLAKYVNMEGFDNFFAQASEEQLAHFLNQSNDYYFNRDFNINPCLLLDMILNDARCESVSYDAEIRRLNRNHEKNLLDDLRIAK